MIEREELDTERDLEDILVTMTEETNLSHSDETSVEYERLNHVPFSYRISLANPGALQKKVMVRLWLGLPSAPGDASEVRREMMVEMDRFVRRLSGSEEETLVRRSQDSLATMKEHGGTLSRSEDF